MPCGKSRSPFFVIFLEIFGCFARLLGCICNHVHVLTLLQACQQVLKSVWCIRIHLSSFCRHTQHHQHCTTDVPDDSCLNSALASAFFGLQAGGQPHFARMPSSITLRLGARMTVQGAYLGCGSAPQPGIPAAPCRWRKRQRALAGGPI